MIIKFSNNNILCTDTFYFGLSDIICSLAVETTLGEPVSPGSTSGKTVFWIAKKTLHVNFYDLFLKK